MRRLFIQFYLLLIGCFTLAILLVGMVSAFVVSIFIIRFLMDYIRKHDFTVCRTESFKKRYEPA